MQFRKFLDIIESYTNFTIKLKFIYFSSLRAFESIENHEKKLNMCISTIENKHMKLIYDVSIISDLSSQHITQCILYRLIYEKNKSKALCSQTVVNQDTQSNQMIQGNYVLYMLVSMIFSVNSTYR